MGRISIPYTLLVLSSMLWLTSASHGFQKTSPSIAKRSIALLPPSQDPFYTAPPGYENAAPGAVLRVRSARGLTQVIPNCTDAYNILYRTTDSNYQPAWAVTTLYIPQTGSTNSTTNSTTGASGSNLLSYQEAYDSASVDRSPSYTYYDGRVDPLIPAALGLGWYVNVPDYEGPLASFTAGVQSGHATIDSVRAVLNSGFGLDSKSKYAMTGYSGGALASGWAAELQVQYAPELNFAGVALGGLVPNVTSGLESANGQPFAWLIVNGILGLASQDPALEQYIISQLRTSGPYNATTFLAARNQTNAADSEIYANQDIFNYFISGASIVQNRVVQARVNRDGIMGFHGVPSMPVFVYHAIGDATTVVANTDALIERYCSVGANILYQRNTVGGHVAEFTNGAGRRLAFLTAVFDGSYAQTYQTVGCTIQNVTVAIDTSPF